jgi:integrase
LVGEARGSGGSIDEALRGIVVSDWITVGLLTSMLDEAVRGRRLPSNPASGVELPRLPRVHKRYLSHEQVARLADECGDEGVVVLTLAYTGIRWG